MATSTDNSGPAETEGRCPYRDVYPPGLLGQLHHHHDCPADLSFWCACRILSEARELEAECQVKGWDYYERLHARFRRIVEDSLVTCFAGAQVFWATREKPKPNEMPAPREGSRPGSLEVNRIIFELNKDYHAHRLLASFAQLRVGRSHIFTIRSTDEGVRLVCHPMVSGDEGRGSGPAFQIIAPLAGGMSVRDLCDEVCRQAASDASDRRATIASRIRDQISTWAAEATWPQGELDSRLDTESDRTLSGQVDWSAKFKEAIQHMALIALYQENNAFSAMTYILAPTLQGAWESSLVVYWPASTGEGPLHLLYLLQAILGQNATGILAKEKRAEGYRNALGHYGHTLKNRAQGLVANLEQEGGTNTQVTFARSLLEIGHILELNVVDVMDDILRMPADKLSRTVEIVSGAGDWDILDEMRSRWVPQWLQGRQLIQFAPLKSAILEPEVDYEVKTCLLGACTGYGFRLVKGLYRQLFWELFRNIARYSHKTNVGTDVETGLAKLACRLWVCREEKVRRGADCLPLLALVNQTSTRRLRHDERSGDVSTDSQPFVEAKKLPEWFQESEEWLEWPESRKFDGPGMAVDLLRRLKIGGLYYKTWVETDGKRTFCTGVWLDGMVVE